MLHCDTLFLSPHLDDAVLSCSLKILHELKAGHAVKTATLFSGAWPKIFEADFYAGRRAEDVAALRCLGTDEPIWLGFSDAIFRSARYWGFSKIVTGDYIREQKLLDQIAVKLRSLYDDLKPKEVFLPLAVGTHIDHRLTFKMWSRLPSDAKVVFYEDRPYSFLAGSVSLRLKEIGAGIEGNGDTYIAGKPQDWARELHSIAMYRNVLKDEYQRARYAAQLAKTVAGKDGIKLKAEVSRTDSTQELEQIVKAIAAYKSQIGMLYGSIKILQDESSAYAQTLDSSAAYAERYWRLM
jgi:LmbE family N-acetylglucosaminyl deacetylase